MRGKYPLKLVVGAAAITLLAAGCSGDGDDTEAPTQSDAAISYEWGEPENPLVPSNTTETRGGAVVDALWTGLINYNTESGEMELANAESMEPDDTSTVYTIKLKSGWTWHDGTPVVAQDYVDAWNWAAYSPNGAANGTFFLDIKGYTDVHTEDPDEDGPLQPPTPKVDKMSGLEVVSETEFKVTLNGPSNLWPLKTGYSAFMPLPKKFFENPETFGQNPIGNGPFKLVSWTKNVELKATRYDEYKGDDKPKIKDITFRVYQEDTAAYADIQAGNLDFQLQVPAATLPGDKYKNDFPDHSINKPIATSEMVAIPFYRREYQNPKLRQALSVAIDRNLITDRIFNKTRIPMNGWVNPNVAGYKADQCGEFCQFNADRAKALLQEGNVTVNPNGSFVSNGVTVPQLSIQYNADASHKEWVDATCNSIQTATGIKCTGKPIPTFGEHRTIIDERKATSLFRAGWQADYPHIENWLNPLLRTGGSSNDGAYSNAAFDAKLKQADETQELEQAEALYQEAEAMLPAEMPTIPMWHRAQQSVWSERLKTVPITVFGELEFTGVEVNEGA
jgi:oligopeptide transport system substrate-binding protein